MKIGRYLFFSIVLVSFAAVWAGCKNAEKNSVGASLVSISVAPPDKSIAVGTNQQFSAFGTYSDKTSIDITSLVSWNSSTTSVATIADDGLAAAVSAGTTTITASAGSISGSAVLSVTDNEITGSVAGRVTDGSKGIADIAVHVCKYKKDNLDTLECIDAGSATTDANGYYTVNNIPGGNYYVHFDAGTTGYASLWYENMRTASHSDTVLVTPPNTVTADAELAPGGGISGTVTDGTTGVGGVWVDVADVDTGFIGAVKTSATGSYSLNGLTPGEYMVRVDGCVEGYMTTPYSTADKIAVSAGQYISGKDMVILPGATISGTITNGTSAIEGVYVLAVSLDDSSSDQFTYTTSSGAYSLRGLSPGNYHLCYSGYDLGYFIQCYKGAAPGATADVISVSPQKVIQNMDDVLSRGGGISGKITDGTTGLSFIEVEVYDTGGGLIDSVRTSYPTGSYYFGGLSSGTYLVCFDAGNSGYVSQCYGNKTWDMYGSTSDPVLVTSPQTTTGIDAVLVKGGAISGTVTDGSAVISDISVYVYDTMGNLVNHSVSNALGDFIVRGLPGGTYTVRFFDYSRGYLNKEIASVSVVSPQTTTGINAVLSMGGSVSGTVTNGTTGLTGISVSVYDTYGRPVGSGYTDGTGAYIVKGLPSGTYQIGFFDYSGTYGQQYYPSTVPVTAPGTTTGINGVLALSGAISGTVTNGTTGLSGISVYVYDSSWKYISSRNTDASGVYTVPGLSSGTYHVEFSDNYGGYISQYYASPVPVTAPQTTTGINAVLVLGGSISGTVTSGTTGAGLSSVSINVYDANSVWYGQVMTNSSGQYIVQHLPSGTYNVKFSLSGYSDLYVNGVNVAAPAETASINAVF